MVSLNLKLYTLVFIDSLSLAFLPPVMASHMVSFGGNHTILGFLGTIHAACQLLSGPVIYSWNGLIGKKRSLILSLFIYFSTYYFLGITASCLVFVILRACFAVTNQTQILCKGIAAIVNPAELMESINNSMNLVGVSGLIIGPIVGGLCFDYLGFYYLTLTASSLLALSFCISLTLPDQTASNNEISFKQKVDLDVISLLKKLRTIDLKKHSSLIVLKSFYIISLSIFFIKFSLALRLNQGLSFTAIGLTYAYQSLVTFLSTFVVNYFSPSLDKKALLQWFCILGVTLSALSNTQIYVLYLGSFVVMAVAHGILTRLYRELFASYKMSDVEDSLTKVISVLIPCVFGIACDFYGLTAFNAFVILPILYNIFIVYAFIKVAKKEKVDEKDD